jgi:hypothetical protein
VLLPKPKKPWTRAQKLLVCTGIGVPILIAVLPLLRSGDKPAVQTVTQTMTVTQPPTSQVPDASKPSPPNTHPKPVPPSIEQHGTGNGAVGKIDQSGNCNINQIGGSGNQATANCGSQLRISERKVDRLATLLSAERGSVSINVKNPDSNTNRDADDLLVAFAKSRTWNYAGVNRTIHGTDIGADNLPIPDPVGIHIYFRAGQTNLADFVKKSLEEIGVKSHEDIDESVKDLDIKIIVGASE